MAQLLGKENREELSLNWFLNRFSDKATAEEWFIKHRWPSDIRCPECGLTNVQTGCHHKTMPFRRRATACGRKFSVRTVR